MSTWHAETASVVLRQYAGACGYATRDPFVAVAFVKFCGPAEVYIEGALRVDGRPLSVGDWRDVARLLRERHGVLVIRAVHKGRILAIDTARAMSR